MHVQKHWMRNRIRRYASENRYNLWLMAILIGIIILNTSTLHMHDAYADKIEPPTIATTNISKAHITPKTETDIVYLESDSETVATILTTPMVNPVPTPVETIAIETKPVSAPTEKIFPSEALSADLQEYAKSICDKNNFPLEIFMALMKDESGYDPSAISSTGDYGLCQINSTNFAWIQRELGAIDFMDPKSSMDAAMVIITTLINSYNCGDNITKLLIYYNMGPGGGSDYMASGNSSSPYSRAIISYAETLGYSK